MKHTLVGYTGFVGGNLAASHSFDALYNTKNITDGFGSDNGLVVYSGMRAEKFLAAADPAADLALAQEAFANIEKMKPEKLVLISTIDVYPNPVGVYEDTPIEQDEAAPAYGKNRLALEGWVRSAYPGALIVRLPGLYGQGLKKNFIRDMLEPAPGMLTTEKYEELAAYSKAVKECYESGRAGYYSIKQNQSEECKKALRAFFARNEFNALSFTDSRSVFQFYNLARLWDDIELCLQNNIALANMAVEPIEAGELYRILFGRSFVNHLEKPPAMYDMRTHNDNLLGGRAGYIAPCNLVADDIMHFAHNWNE